MVFASAAVTFLSAPLSLCVLTLKELFAQAVQVLGRIFNGKVPASKRGLLQFWMVNNL